MKRLRLYLETSVWNFVFADDAPEKKEKTLIFFEELESAKYEIYISDIVIGEIEDAESPKRDKLMLLIKKHNPIMLVEDSEAKMLADKYIENKIVPKKFEEDAIHMAIAVTNDLDAIVSWNLEHIVKLKTKLAVNGINKLEGFKEIEICTPEEVIESED